MNEVELFRPTVPAQDESAAGDLGPLDVLRMVIATDDTAVLRRVKALAATRPIHDLARNRGSYEGTFWERFDLASLALATIDQVALHMGISAGLRFEETVAYCVGEAARQQPSEAEATWAAVATKVVGSLISTEPNQMPYIAVAGGEPVERVYTYRLLYEQWGGDDLVYLRASEEAINVLVNGLDVDVESAQIAAEAQMRALIDRNAYELAATIAAQARYQTIKYLERIRSVVHDTVLDPDAHDWERDVPDELNRALQHVEDRITAERALIVSIEDQRDVIVDVAMRRSANGLVALVRDCLSRHTDLQRHLMGARSQLRRAQDERFARRRSSIARADLERDLLVPLFGASPAQVADWSSDTLTRFGALRRAFMPTFAVTVDDCSTVQPDGGTGDVVDEPEFATVDVEPWWERYWEAADACIAELDAPVLLSQLLARIDDGVMTDRNGERFDTSRLMVALCHVAFEHTAQRLVGELRARVVIAVPTGARLDCGPVHGDDLLLVPAAIATSDLDGAGRFDAAVSDLSIHRPSTTGDR